MKKILIILTTFIITFLTLPILNAASGKIEVSSSSTAVVNNKITVTVKLSSASTIGSWQMTLNYDKKYLQLTSSSAEAGGTIMANSSSGIKSKSYTFVFKALKSGSTKVSIGSYLVYDYNTMSEMSISVVNKTITLKTQAEIEASYSKNNNLKSLGVEGYEISPVFNKDTLEYSVLLSANVESINIIASVEDSKASISGTGVKEVSEGENKFNIVVTAENGSTKTYTLTAIVTDSNPITVTTVSGETKTIVKRESVLTIPETFTKTTVTINDIEVPAFYSELTKLTLVGLKDEAGPASLYVYDSNKNSYTPYTEIAFSQIKFYPMDVEKDKFKNYKLFKINLNDKIEVNAYKINKSSDFAIIYGMNIETGEKGYYLYDSKERTITRYNAEEADILNDKVEKYYSLIIGLTVESIFLLIIIIVMLIKIFTKKRVHKEKKHKEQDDVEKEITEFKEKKKKKNKDDKN